MRIFKICSNEIWDKVRLLTEWEGSPHDLRDGFIHFSTESQLEGTLRKHYTDQTDLMLLEIDGESLGEALKWEPSRGGELFPHLYGALPTASIRSATRLK